MIAVGCQPQGGPAAGKGATADGKDSEAAPAASGKPKKAAGKRPAGAHIGEIPKDAWPEVWFDNPSAVAAESRRTAAQTVSTERATSPPKGTSAGAPQATSDGGKPREEAASASPPGLAAGSNDWGGLIAADVLADEIKALKSSLEAKTASLSVFNGAYKEIQYDATTLAALAQIAGEFPEGPSWKKNAKFVRDVAAEMSRESTSLGDKFYKPTKTAFERLDSLFSGSPPSGLGESADKMAYSSFAPRLALMKRIDRSHKWLKSNVNTAELLKKESDAVVQEAAVLAVLGRVIAMGGYDDSDVDLYQQLVGGVVQGAQAAGVAARERDFDAYTAALDAVYKSCTQCHSEFKNN